MLASGSAAVDLMILDMTMPDMSGLETLVEVRKSLRGLPVILSSGYDQSEATARFQDLDIAGFLQKPYATASLAAAVQRVLRRQAEC